MAYRYDPDLEFLQNVKSENLEQLVEILVYDPKDGNKRISEELSSKENYIKYWPDHNKYWKEIAEEIQKYGGNSIANFFRDTGVLYKEILMDVCDKLKVNYNKNASTEIIENNLLMKVLEKALEDMTEEERKELLESIGIKNTTNFSQETLLGIFQAVFRAGGFKSYQLTVIIANAILKALIGRGLSLAGNAMLTRTMAILTGPIGWAITALWTAFDIAGPAYRVTIPAVIEISVLRKKYLYDNKVDEVNFS